MKFNKKDNELIEKIADYFEEKYGPVTVVVATDEDMAFSERNYTAKQAMNMGAAMITHELEEAFGNEEDAEIKFDEIMKEIGNED